MCNTEYDAVDKELYSCSVYKGQEVFAGQMFGGFFKTDQDLDRFIYNQYLLA